MCVYTSQRRKHTFYYGSWGPIDQQNFILEISLAVGFKQATHSHRVPSRTRIFTRNARGADPIHVLAL